MSRVDIRKGEQNRPEYRRLNPMGKVPTLTDGDVVVWESGAICAYLADRYPQAGLAPAIDDVRRGAYLRWLFFASSDIEPAFATRHAKLDAPPLALAWGDYDRVVEAMVTALRPGPYVLGQVFSAADIMLGSAVFYGTQAKLLDPRPEFAAYLETIQGRPAMARALAKDTA